MRFDFDISSVTTPAYLVDLGALRRNLEILADVQRRAECKILLALKGFAMWPVFDLISAYLPGITASSTHEARLGAEEFSAPGKRREVHACAPAYSDDDFTELLGLCDHIVFNSPTQARRLMPRYRAHLERGGKTLHFGLRVNHEHREVEVAIYDPCGPRSRLGTRRNGIAAADLEGMSGLHFHSLCELGADALARTLPAFEARFADLLPDLSWVNMGGGHHITRADYDVDLLVELIRSFRSRHDVEVYLEPGEAIALGTGVLVASVLDLMDNDGAIAILDTSVSAHMPDVLEMPYRPEILGAGKPGELAHDYRLGGATCLAGDVVGDYSFDRPLRLGDKLVFADMAHYTMVKNTTFNGVRLPSIGTADPDDGSIEILRRFGYADYKNRLG